MTLRIKLKNGIESNQSNLGISMVLREDLNLKKILQEISESNEVDNDTSKKSMAVYANQ